MSIPSVTSWSCDYPLDQERFYLSVRQEIIEISYESLGLSPTEMRPLRHVLKEMEDDEAQEISIRKRGLTFRLIVFHYFLTMTNINRLFSNPPICQCIFSI
jgi:hypothetical protein